jgi:hypothetical protein
LIFLEPKTYKDEKGNAVLEIPRRFWEGKDLPSLKVHLSQQILKNLSGGEEENHDCELQRTIHILRQQRTGWVGLENGRFC